MKTIIAIIILLVSLLGAWVYANADGSITVTATVEGLKVEENFGGSQTDQLKGIQPAYNIHNISRGI